MRTPDRPDWLRQLQVVLIVGLVLFGVIGGFGTVALVTEPIPVELPASEVTGTIDDGLRAGASVAREQDLQVTVADPSLGQRVAWALTSLPTYAVVVALLGLLLRIVWYARRGDPFTPANVRRLRVLAMLALFGGTFAFVVELAAAFQLSSTVLVNNLAAETELPLVWLLVGVGLFALAEVVRRGCAMRAELETVV